MSGQMLFLMVHWHKRFVYSGCLFVYSGYLFVCLFVCLFFLLWQIKKLTVVTVREKAVFVENFVADAERERLVV